MLNASTAQEVKVITQTAKDLQFTVCPPFSFANNATTQ